MIVGDNVNAAAQRLRSHEKLSLSWLGSLAAYSRCVLNGTLPCWRVRNPERGLGPSLPRVTTRRFQRSILPTSLRNRPSRAASTLGRERLRWHFPPSNPLAAWVNAGACLWTKQLSAFLL
jgi:hypothetical protein